jgi:hypothetical protein
MNNVIDGNSDVDPDMEDNEEVDTRSDVKGPETQIGHEDTRRPNDPTVQREALVLIRVDY